MAKNLAKNEGRRLQRRFVTPEADFRIKGEETVQVRSAVSSSLPEEMMRERQLGERLERVLAELPPSSARSLRCASSRDARTKRCRTSSTSRSARLKAKAKRVRLKVLGEMQPLLDDSS